MTGVRKTSSLTKETEKMLETAVDLLGAGKEREEEADAVSQASQASYAVSKFTCQVTPGTSWWNGSR